MHLTIFIKYLMKNSDFSMVMENTMKLKSIT